MTCFPPWFLRRSGTILLLLLSACVPLAAQSAPGDPARSLPDDPGQTNQPQKDQGQKDKQENQNPKVKAKEKSRTPNATNTSPSHMYWVIPAFKVDYAGKFQPLTPKEKFSEWAESNYDPLGIGVSAFEAGTLEYSSSDGFCGYGHGFGGYGECFGSLELDGAVSSFIGDYLLTVAWHQDPRYFRLGQGSFARRVLYSISRVFVTFNDQGKNVFYSSGLTGTFAAAAISNLYYPPQDVGVGSTISRAGLDLSNTAIYNAAAEFWPDIHRHVHFGRKPPAGQ
jgi:hypothetical protein